MTGLVHDVRDGLRALRRAPAFTTVVVLTLALGIGVNTAIFSAVDAALFRPLPYPEANRLVRVAEWPETGGNFTVAPAALLHFRTHSRAFSGIEAASGGTVALFTGGEPQSLRSSSVTAGYFDLLGVRAERGRAFVESEDAADHGCRVVIGHQLWTSRFSADPAIVGRSLTFDAGPCVVTGVLPLDAIFNRAAADVYFVLRLGPDAAAQQGRVLNAIGRLAPGVSIERARAELAGVAAGFNATRGPAGRGWTTALTPLADVLVRTDTRRLAWILIATVASVLLVACVNVAGLAISRTLDRRREVAVRVALGATRVRLFRALVVENLLLAAAGGLAALLVGSWTLRLFVTLIPAGLLPTAGASLNGTVLAFTAVLSIATGLIVGTLPAWQGARAPALDALAAGGRTLTASRGTSRLRAGLVVTEIALATTLVYGATLLVVSFYRLSAVDAGIATARVLTLPLTLPVARYPAGPQVAEGFERLLDSVRTVPGVEHASVVTSLPLGGWRFGVTFTVEGLSRPGDRQTSAHIQSVARDYFVTLGIPLDSGREFTPADSATSLPVAVVNATFVRRFIPDGRALGRGILMDGRRWEIVGVNRDVKTGGLADAPFATPEIYVPHGQSPVSSMFMAIRTAGDPLRLGAAIRTAVGRVDASLPLGRFQTMEERLAGSVSTPRFRAAMIGTFAVLAGLLASVGVYAVRAQAVAGRRREMGIRIALGATRARVFRLVWLQGLRQVVLGLALGLLAARALAQVVEPWLFATRTTEPGVIAVALAALTAAALIASWAPARRAASVDPLTTLRQE